MKPIKLKAAPDKNGLCKDIGNESREQFAQRNEHKTTLKSTE